MRYRKKPIEIEAVEYASDGNFHRRYKGQVPDWLWVAFETGTITTTNGNDPLFIHTLEGKLTISPGDWIIRGVQGEIYPCKPDIFEATYEKVEL